MIFFFVGAQAPQAPPPPPVATPLPGTMQRGMIIKSESCVGAYPSLQSTFRRFGAAGDCGKRDFVFSLYKL